MNIVQVMPEFGLAGAEIMCENLTYELVKNGHKVTIISLYDYYSGITERLERAGISIIYLGKHLGLDLSMIWKIRKVLKEIRPDVIHTHRYVLQYVFPASAFLGVKTVVHTIHNTATKENSKISRIVNGFFFKFFGVVPVALSELIQSTISKEYKIKDDKIPVIFNAISLDKCVVKQSYDIEDNMNILHIGRFCEQKNHKVLIKVFVHLHNLFPMARLHLVGEGPLKNEIIKLISDCKADDYIIVHGLINNPYSLLNKADIFVLPSLYEGLPMTLIEAMGTALPIVASKVGGIPDMIEDGVSGVLCEPNEDSITNALTSLLSNKEIRERLGKTAKDRASNFSSSKMALKYLRVYDGTY
jgi:glycosyltransferase involved in cell wall biosynthesis